MWTCPAEKGDDRESERMKLTGKPYAGNLHVRFDEGGGVLLLLYSITG